MNFLKKLKQKSVLMTNAGLIMFFARYFLGELEVVMLPSWVAWVGAIFVVVGTLLYFKR